jgi:hypothetical protein
MVSTDTSSPQTPQQHFCTMSANTLTASSPIPQHLLHRSTVIDFIRMVSASIYCNAAAEHSDDQLWDMFRVCHSKGFNTAHAMEIAAMTSKPFTVEEPISDDMVYTLKTLKGGY